MKAADELSDEEKAQPCLVEYAGQKLTTGKQAECYANNYIGLHLKSTAGGKTYAEFGAPQSALRAQVAEAEKAAAAMLILALFGFTHALVTPKNKTVGIPNREVTDQDRIPANV